MCIRDRSLIVKSRQNRIELVTRPAVDLQPIPTPAYGPEVAPVPVEVAPTTPLDPTYYARELPDIPIYKSEPSKDSYPGPQSSPTTMDFFDPMVEFLPEQRRSIYY